MATKTEFDALVAAIDAETTRIGNKIQDLAIRPGTTTADVLRELGVSDSHWLSARDGTPFAHDEDVYGRVRDGQKLFTSAPC